MTFDGSTGTALPDMSDRERCVERPAMVRRVYVVDDDASVRSSLVFLLRALGADARPCSSGQQFVDGFGYNESGVVLLDLRMPGIDGMETLEFIKRAPKIYAVVVMTGHGDIATAVRAMKAGAVDFLEKPFEEEALTFALDNAFAALNSQIYSRRSVETALALLNDLTAREADVLAGLSDGLPNKLIAHHLGLSVRTVEMHRASLMERLGVRSLSDALRLVFLSGWRGGVKAKTPRVEKSAAGHEPPPKGSAPRQSRRIH